VAELLAGAGAMDAARLAPQVRMANDNDKVDNKPEGNEDDENFLEVRKLRTQFLEYLTTKVDEIDEQQDSRRQYHGSQWSPDQIKILRRRKQPPLTWNRINRKINGIIGVVELLRSDPKALPRHPRSEQGADLATQTVRSVLEASDFKGEEPWVLLQSAIDGIGGVQLVLTRDDKGQPDISIVPVIGDEFFYDPTSYLPDFSDAGYKGVGKWVSLDVAISLFPDKEEILRGLIAGDSDLTTSADREYKWVITSQQRIRLVEHWYRHKGQWRWAFYVSSVLLDQGVSPFYNERNETVSSYCMFAVAVDHDGDRYSFVRNLKDPQASLNQSKSKALHVANSRRIIATKGAVDDVEKARTEMARPDGYIEVNPGGELKPDDKPQDVAAFTEMANNAAQEIDSYANINTAVLQGASLANISGRAIELLRQPGMAELGPFILSIRKWKLGLFRLIWSTAQRHWTTEKWLRITDDDSQKPVFIQLNGLTLDPQGRPTLVNALGALDVDITMEEGPDIATLMQETFDLLKGYPPGTFPPNLIIEASQLPRAEKNKLLKMLQPPPQPPNPMQEQAAKLQLEGAAVKNAKTAAEARRADAMSTKALHEAQQGNDQSAIDHAELSHRMMMETLQLFQPQQQPGQQGQQPKPGQGGMPPEIAQAMMQSIQQRARRAPDGNHYIRHPSGQHLRVERRAPAGG